MRDYYDQRAAEYDQTITDDLDPRVALALASEAAAHGGVLAALPSCRVLDVACGTALFTQHLCGQVVALDQSERMLQLARARLPAAQLVRAVVPPLPFAGAAFDRLFTSHIHGHLEEPERAAFLDEARRVAPELVVVDSAVYDDTVQPEEWQERILRDGSRYTIFKRHFTAERLLAELGSGEVLFDGRFFVAVRSSGG
jgi:ubiquinone/menaquinone biosynthesis C-methylase UbiE